MTDITDTDRYECLAALYAKRYGRLAPGKDERVQYTGSEDDRYHWMVWQRYEALADAIDRIIELERELAAARAAIEREPL